MLALTILFLSIVLGVRIFFYYPMRAAMGGHDPVSMFFLNTMYWGFVLLVAGGYGVAITLL